MSDTNKGTQPYPKWVVFVWLILATGPFSCYNIHCYSDWAWRTEYLHSIDLPESAGDIENENWGTASEVFTPSRSWFTIDPEDLCVLITQLEEQCLTDSPPHDSIITLDAHSDGYWSDSHETPDRGFLRSGDTLCIERSHPAQDFSELGWFTLPDGRVRVHLTAHMN